MTIAIIRAANSLFNIINTLVIIDVFASWLPFLYSNRIIAKILYMIHSLTQPIMNPVRKLIAKTPLGNTPIDFSPIIVLLLLNFIQTLVITTLLLVL